MGGGFQPVDPADVGSSAELAISPPANDSDPGLHVATPRRRMAGDPVDPLAVRAAAEIGALYRAREKFDKLLTIGRAYADIGEHERAYLGWRALAEVSYLEDARVAEMLRGRNQPLEAAAVLVDLRRAYSDEASIESDFFDLSRLVASLASRPSAELGEVGRDAGRPAGPGLASGNLFASGIVLMSSLDLDLTEQVAGGLLRVSARDASTGARVPDVQINVIGSSIDEGFEGQTDLRGVFLAQGLRGQAVVVASQGNR